MRVVWNNGIRAESEDGATQIKAGGRIFNDWSYVHEDDDLTGFIGGIEDGTEFRATRLYLSGEVENGVVFKAQYDFAAGEAAFKDVYVGLKGLPGVGTVRVGQFWEPLGMDEQTSSNDITFMERSLVSALVPSRHTGVLAQNHVADNRLTWAAGLFRETDSVGKRVGDGEHNVTARVSALPLLADDESRLLHVGASVSRRSPNDDMVRYRQRPEAHLSPTLLDTGSIPAESVDLFGGELGAQSGPVSLQAEVVHASVSRPSGGDPGFTGYSVQGSWVLTGERRDYKRKEGVFGTVKPRRNYGAGPGAWELAARLSHLDLYSKDIEAGELTDVTTGLNWYLNPNARIMFNTVFSDLKSHGSAVAFMSRFQINI